MYTQEQASPGDVGSNAVSSSHHCAATPSPAVSSWGSTTGPVDKGSAVASKLHKAACSSMGGGQQCTCTTVLQTQHNHNSLEASNSNHKPLEPPEDSLGGLPPVGSLQGSSMRVQEHKTVQSPNQLGQLQIACYSHSLQQHTSEIGQSKSFPSSNPRDYACHNAQGKHRRKIPLLKKKKSKHKRRQNAQHWKGKSKIWSVESSSGRTRMIKSWLTPNSAASIIDSLLWKTNQCRMPI